jgi:cytochrome c oxidase cbb3-type subunit 2
MSNKSVNKHEKVETNVGLFFILAIIAISIGGLVEITPLFFQQATTKPVTNLKPYTALQLEGRDIYIREGCHVCHSQMIRPFRAETERYGHYSVAGESVWEHPFLWGSKRTGPDLARVGGRYSDDWHRAHLIDPRSVVPESNMPSFKWLDENVLDGELTAKKLETFNFLTRTRSHKNEKGEYIPLYSAEDIAGAKAAVKGKTEMEALIAYLQSLGHALK